MIKIIISITVILISALCGDEFYKRKREKVMAIQELSRIVENIIISIDYLSLDVYEICKRVFINRNHLDYSRFIDIESGDFPLMWENACKASLSEIPLNIRNKFIEIGSFIGACDSESQIKKLEYIKDELQKSYEEYYDKLNREKKLYSTVSLCIGILTVLIVI